MKPKAFILIIIFNFVFKLTYCVDGSYFNKDSVRSKVKEYTTLLSDYSKCHCENWFDKKIDILELFDESSNDADEGHYGDWHPHEFDLFYNENGKQLVTYLDILHYFPYKNQVEIFFSEGIVADSLKNGNLALVSIEKKIVFNGLIKNVSIIIYVDVSSYHYFLNEVNLKENVLNDLSFFGSNLISNNQFNLLGSGKTIDLKQLYLNIADSAFNVNNFSFAEENYKKAQEFGLGDKNLNHKILMCERKTTFNSLLTEADNYYNNNQFAAAQKIYTNLVNEFPQKQNELISKMKLCTYEINRVNFNEYASLADDKFKKGVYKRAIKYYKKSLEYQPNNPYTASMLNKCESIIANKGAVYSLTPLLSLTYGFPHLLEAGKEYYGTVVVSYQYLGDRQPELEINLPVGCTATINPSEIQGSAFQFDGQKIRFVWTDLPKQNPFMISYKVTVAPDIKNPIEGKLKGKFSYTESGKVNNEYFENDFYLSYRLKHPEEPELTPRMNSNNEQPSEQNSLNSSTQPLIEPVIDKNPKNETASPKEDNVFKPLYGDCTSELIVIRENNKTSVTRKNRYGENIIVENYYNSNRSPNYYYKQYNNDTFIYWNSDGSFLLSTANGTCTYVPK